MVSRPYQLRVILDVALSAEEWGLVAQAFLPDPPAERALRLQVYDGTQDPDLAASVVAEIQAKPAKLLLNPPG